MELQIESEHVLLHVWNGRPFLFWLDFILNGTQGQGAQFDGSTISVVPQYEVRLSCSEFRDGAWSAQHQSRQVISILQSLAGEDTRGVVFRIDTDSDDAVWVVWQPA